MSCKGGGEIPDGSRFPSWQAGWTVPSLRGGRLEGETCDVSCDACSASEMCKGCAG